MSKEVQESIALQIRTVCRDIEKVKSLITQYEVILDEKDLDDGDLAVETVQMAFRDCIKAELSNMKADLIRLENERGNAVSRLTEYLFRFELKDQAEICLQICDSIAAFDREANYERL